MKKWLNIALFTAVLCMATSNFSGCGGGSKEPSQQASVNPM